jgi:hypothetical protein
MGTEQPVEDKDFFGEAETLLAGITEEGVSAHKVLRAIQVKNISRTAMCANPQGGPRGRRNSP